MQNSKQDEDLKNMRVYALLMLERGKSLVKWAIVVGCFIGCGVIFIAEWMLNVDSKSDIPGYAAVILGGGCGLWMWLRGRQLIRNAEKIGKAHGFSEIRDD